MLENLIYDNGTCYKLDSITYKLSGGFCLFEDNKQAGMDIRRVEEGETLNVAVDHYNSIVEWRIGKLYRIERELPKNFRNKKIYPFVSMRNYGDIVEFV